MNKVFELIFAPFIKAQQKAQEEVAPIIMNPNQEYTPVRRLNSIRGQQFEWFANQVIEHIETYTVHQYGDYPDDQEEEWTPELCIAQIGKYSARFGKNFSEGQELLALHNIAHYAHIDYSKMKK